MFNEAKATALGAFFLKKATHFRMSRFDLLKLMFAAERFCLREESRLIVGDLFFNMEHGPVMSETYDCIKGRPKGIWATAIRPKDRYDVELYAPDRVPNVLNVDEEGYAELSWETYHQILSMPLNQKSNLMHEEFPEWKNPGEYRRTVLELQTILHEGLGFDVEDAEECQESILVNSALKSMALRHG